MLELTAHVTIEDTKVQSGLGTSPRSQSKELVEQGRSPALSVVPSGGDMIRYKSQRKIVVGSKDRGGPRVRGIITEVTSTESLGGATLRGDSMGDRRNDCL